MLQRIMCQIVSILTVYDRPEILHLPDILVSWTPSWTDGVEHFLTKSMHDIAVLGKEVDSNREHGSGLVCTDGE